MQKRLYISLLFLFSLSILRGQNWFPFYTTTGADAKQESDIRTGQVAGTLNYFPRFASSNTLTNSLLSFYSGGLKWENTSLDIYLNNNLRFKLNDLGISNLGSSNLYLGTYPSNLAGGYRNSFVLGGTSITSGYYNTGFGDSNASSCTTCNNNTFFGYLAGGDLLGGAGNTYLGSYAGTGGASHTNFSVLGYNAGKNYFSPNNFNVIGASRGNIDNSVTIAATYTITSVTGNPSYNTTATITPVLAAGRVGKKFSMKTGASNNPTGLSNNAWVSVEALTDSTVKFYANYVSGNQTGGTLGIITDPTNVNLIGCNYYGGNNYTALGDPSITQVWFNPYTKFDAFTSTPSVSQEGFMYAFNSIAGRFQATDVVKIGDGSISAKSLRFRNYDNGFYGSSSNLNLGFGSTQRFTWGNDSYFECIAPSNEYYAGNRYKAGGEVATWFYYAGQGLWGDIAANRGFKLRFGTNEFFSVDTAKTTIKSPTVAMPNVPFNQTNSLLLTTGDGNFVATQDLFSLLKNNTISDTFAITSTNPSITVLQNCTSLDVAAYTNSIDTITVILPPTPSFMNQTVNIFFPKMLMGQGDKIKFTVSGNTEFEIVNDVTDTLSSTYEFSNVAPTISATLTYNTKRQKWRLINYMVK